MCTDVYISLLVVLWHGRRVPNCTFRFIIFVLSCDWSQSTDSETGGGGGGCAWEQPLQRHSCVWNKKENSVADLVVHIPVDILKQITIWKQFAIFSSWNIFIFWCFISVVSVTFLLNFYLLIFLLTCSIRVFFILIVSLYLRVWYMLFIHMHI